MSNCRVGHRAFPPDPPAADGLSAPVACGFVLLPSTYIPLCVSRLLSHPAMATDRVVWEEGVIMVYIGRAEYLVDRLAG